jgi:STE24 endopeptidase
MDTQTPQPTLDAERQEQARQYARLRRRFMLLSLGLSGGYALAWLVFGWSKALGVALGQLTDNPWLLVAAFGAVFGGIYYLLDLPLSYYTGFVLPHRFQLSTQTLRGWISDQLKLLALGGLIGGLLLELLYLTLRTYPTRWWLWMAGILLFFNLLLAHLAPVLIAPLFHKFVPLETEHGELVDRLLKLAAKTGTRVQGVFTFDMSRRTKAANAALFGLGNTRRIILGDTLLQEFTPDEIETILAHELGHQVHKDILWGILVQIALTVGGLYLTASALQWAVTRLEFGGVADISALPLLGLFLGLYGLITTPLGNAYSRWRERLADDFAVQITGKGSAFAAALTRLANQNLAEADPEPWVEFLLYAHPALSKRIARAQRSASTQPTTQGPGD